MVDLSFRQLEVFAQVVECGSFRSAAEQLDISQVSVSAHVSSLEELLGTYASPASAAARSKLRIAAHGYIAERFSRRLAAFASSHPEIEIELERRPLEGVVRGMQASDIEIGFFLSRGPVRYAVRGPFRRDRTTHQLVECLSQQHHG